MEWEKIFASHLTDKRLISRIDEMASLCFSLTGLKDAQISGKTFLGMFVKAFLEELSV